MATYVVAGVTGRVGSVVADELLAQNHGVRGIIRDPARAAAWSARGGDVAIGSLEDSAFLASTLRGADGIFVLLPEDPFSPDFHGIRRAMADAIASAIRETGVPHVVVLSAVAACLPDGNGPAKDLNYLERAVRRAAAKATILRACWFQENVGAVLGAANHAGIYPNLMASADAAFPTIATRDVGRIAASFLVAPPPTTEVIDLMGPVYSTRQFASALGSALGKSLQVIDVPPPARVAALEQAGLPTSFAQDVAELYACFESGRIRPQGDRVVTGSTTIEETLAGLVSHGTR